MSNPISISSQPLHTEQVLNHEHDKSKRSALKNMILNRKINDKPIERDKLAEALLFDV